MAGLFHGDVEPRNVVKGPRGMRLIDFSHAFEEHDCPGSECYELEIVRNYLGLGRFTPENVSSVCYTIY
jgi:hypothetical protein